MKQTHIFKDPPGVIASAAVGGKMEGEGPMGEYFDKINDVKMYKALQARSRPRSPIG